MALTSVVSWVLVLLCSVSVVSATDDDSPFGKGGKFCPPYRCPKGQTGVQRWPAKFSSPGCTTGGIGGMNMFAPGKDKEGPEVMRRCCDLRNACLQTCGAVKTWCDEAFKKCGTDACAKEPSSRRESCDRDFEMHKIMIGLQNDCSAYDAAQAGACQCVKSEKAGDTRKQFLRSFYKKYSPDGLDKVDGLAAKADTSSKFSSLMYKLLDKYPKAITQVEDPQQAYFDKILRDAENKDKKKAKQDDDEEIIPDEKIEL